MLSPFLGLDPRERNYTQAIQTGELRLDLLFPDNAAEAARLAEHPAIRWKILNARGRLNKGGASSP